MRIQVNLPICGLCGIPFSDLGSVYARIRIILIGITVTKIATERLLNLGVDTVDFRDKISLGLENLVVKVGCDTHGIRRRRASKERRFGFANHALPSILQLLRI